MQLTKNQISNIQSIRKPNAIGVKGVWKDRDKWRARITFDGKPINLGSHDTLEGAQEAYEAAARKLFGVYYKSPEPIKIDIDAPLMREELHRLRSNLGAIKSMLKRAQGEIDRALGAIRGEPIGPAKASVKRKRKSR
jgi:hypothetical protein